MAQAMGTYYLEYTAAFLGQARQVLTIDLAIDVDQLMFSIDRISCKVS